MTQSTHNPTSTNDTPIPHKRKSSSTKDTTNHPNATESPKTSVSLSPNIIVIFIVLLVCSTVYYLTSEKSSSFAPAQGLRLTRDQLRLYNGMDASKPIYISILGRIFDVSNAKHFYGPESSYSFFAGRDGTRSLVSGCFQKGCRTDVKDLSEKDMQGIKEWVEFFEEKYPMVGELVDYDPMEEREAD